MIFKSYRFRLNKRHSEFLFIRLSKLLKLFYMKISARVINGIHNNWRYYKKNYKSKVLKRFKYTFDNDINVLIYFPQ